MTDAALPLPAERDGLRHALRARRRAIAPGDRPALDAAACSHALQFEPLGRAPTVGLYRAFDGEVDAAALAEAVAARGGRVCWARIAADEAAGLEFVCAESWRSDRGLPVPEGPTVALGAADLVVVPGVGFDLGGGRLGRGRGHYDRYLDRHPVQTLGLARACQVVPALPLAAHDRPVSALATEHRLWVFAETSEDEV